jgi:hypothetical protein
MICATCFSRAEVAEPGQRRRLSYFLYLKFLCSLLLSFYIWGQFMVEDSQDEENEPVEILCKSCNGVGYMMR